MKQVLECFAPGRRIYLPGGPSEILPLAERLAAEPERMAGVDLTFCLMPGVNRLDYAALHPAGRLTTFMMSPALQPSERLRILPLCYSATGRYLTGPYRPDCAVAHVAAPDADGLCSLGVSADFMAQVWPRAAWRVLVVNARMPRIRRAPHLAVADAHLVVEMNAPLAAPPPERTDPITERIAAAVAALVPNGAAVECGLGGAPSAVWRHLHGHRDLTVATGMVTSALRGLAEAGALRDGSAHHAGMVIGEAPFHDWLESGNLIELVPATRSHDRAGLARLPAFIAINSALEVDLFGQTNLEWRGGRQVSGVGGAPDFVQAALASPGGRSITALPATADGGAFSRIVARLDAPTVSIPRSDIGTVVTEYGVAELRDLSIEDRARALIEIAAPAHRDGLRAQWHAMQ